MLPKFKYGHPLEGGMARGLRSYGLEKAFATFLRYLYIYIMSCAQQDRFNSWGFQGVMAMLNGYQKSLMSMLKVVAHEPLDVVFAGSRLELSCPNLS